MTLLGSEHSVLIRSKFRSVLQLRLQQRRTREQRADQGGMPLNHGKFLKQEDSYAFEEEDSSSDSQSPQQHHSDESQGVACPCLEPAGSTPSSSSSPARACPRQGAPIRDPPEGSQDEGLSDTSSSHAAMPIPVPAVAKSKPSDKNRHKKPKDVKPKVKKLKYHQYIPPDQKVEKSPPPMDSAYARLLQQQQLFLQLQILSQQKHAHAHTQQAQGQGQGQGQGQDQPSFSYQPMHTPAHAHKSSSEQHPPCSSSGPACMPDGSSSSPAKHVSQYASPSGISPVKPGPLPANLDDLKVSELRQQLRIRGMPVSGTKTALIERLRPFRDLSPSPSSGSSDITTVTFPVTPTGSYRSPSQGGGGGYHHPNHQRHHPYPSTSSSTPPISPASSELSLSGSLPDSFSDVPMSPLPPPGPAEEDEEEEEEEEEEGPAGGPGGRAVRGGGGGTEGGLEAEKDKMLVEKQKVIEELTWKLHQEQRQVEELKMQLHKRKRCYGATLDDGHPLPHHHAHLHPPPAPLPPQLGQHFFGVTIKQEPLATSSGCPLSSPGGHAATSPTTGCMEELAHCAMSSFLSPQCSPQDSPVGKPPSSSSPQPPSSTTHAYLLSPLPLGRDGCGHPLTSQGHGRACSMQMQQKSGGQPMSCSFPPDQRGLPGAFPSLVDCGLNHRGSGKASNHSPQQPKMSVLPSPRPAPAFSSSESGVSDLRQPPCYEDAVKQQLTRSQQMDELLDVLIESGEMPANAREERERWSSVTKVVPHITVFPGSVVPRLHRHYEHLLGPYGHSANHIADSHLETLLGSPTGRGGEGSLLKMAADDGLQEDEGHLGREGYRSPHPYQHYHHHHYHLHHDKLRDLIDTPTPLSPISGKMPCATDAQGLVGMAFGESPWETMEWLDLTPPSSATAFSVAPPNSGPSIFNTEFLDVTDINLNSTDLHLDHW